MKKHTMRAASGRQRRQINNLKDSQFGENVAENINRNFQKEMRLVGNILNITTFKEKKKTPEQ